MNINLEELERGHWFEDEEGNVITKDQFKDMEGKPIYYRRCYPLELHEYLDEYCYHPKNPIIKFLCRHSQRFYKWISKGKDRTFRNIIDGTTAYDADYAQRCIVAMVNSGDFTLEQAIYVYAKSCERCMNVLLHKYLNGEDGYPEYSEDWKKARTCCTFCEGEK